MSNSVTSIRVALTLVSSNRKTGPMPISVSSRPSCPKDCPFYDNGCYGEYGNTLPHWIKVSDGRRGVSWETFCAKTRKIPYGQTWRHNVVGDLPSEDRVHINRDALTMLVRSQRGCHGFTFTHYSPFIKENAGIIRYANENGFTINLSANNLADADAKAALGIAPVAMVLPIKTERVSYTPAGRKILQCPATYREDVTCATCRICSWAKPDRAIIGFPAHGTAKRKAEAIALSL